MEISDNLSPGDHLAINVYGTCHPFIKWAGGKSRLISQIKNFYPQRI